jgi:DNA-binding LytR/AlgR family response regulator
MQSNKTIHGFTPLADLVGPLLAQARQTHGADAVVSRHRRRVRRHQPAQISHFVARNKQTYFYCGGRRQRIGDSLNSLQKRLAGAAFFRVHRAILVNLRYVRAVRRARRGAQLLLQDKRTLPVSRRARNDLLQRLRIGWSRPT